MNKSELIKKIAEKMSIEQTKAKVALEGVLESIKEGVKEDGSVALVGFGTFKSKDVAASKVKTPAGKIVDVPAHKRAGFSVGKEFKDYINS